MAFYVLFENKNTFLFLYFIFLLFNLQMCQIILPDLVYINAKTIFVSNWKGQASLTSSDDENWLSPHKT